MLGALVLMLGVGFGLFSAVALFFGIEFIPYVFFHDNAVDFGGDLFELIMSLLIGTVSLLVAIRWVRGGIRMVSGTSLAPHANNR